MRNLSDFIRCIDHADTMQQLKDLVDDLDAAFTEDKCEIFEHEWPVVMNVVSQKKALIESRILH